MVVGDIVRCEYGYQNEKITWFPPQCLLKVSSITKWVFR